MECMDCGILFVAGSLAASAIFAGVFLVTKMWQPGGDEPTDEQMRRFVAITKDDLEAAEHRWRVRGSTSRNKMEGILREHELINK